MRSNIQRMGYYWKRIVNDIDSFIKNCYGCQSTKKHDNQSIPSMFKKIWKNPK